MSARQNMSGDSGVPEHVYNTNPQKNPMNLREPSMDSQTDPMEDRNEESKSHAASEDSDGGDVMVNP